MQPCSHISSMLHSLHRARSRAVRRVSHATGWVKAPGAPPRRGPGRSASPAPGRPRAAPPAAGPACSRRMCGLQAAGGPPFNHNSKALAEHTLHLVCARSTGWRVQAQLQDWAGSTVRRGGGSLTWCARFRAAISSTFMPPSASATAHIISSSSVLQTTSSRQTHLAQGDLVQPTEAGVLWCTQGWNLANAQRSSAKRGFEWPTPRRRTGI